MLVRIPASVWIVMLLCVSRAAFAAEKPAAVDFAADIQPLFARHCSSCHGADQQESNYRLDRKAVAFAGGDLGEKAIIPGKSGESPLLRYVSGEDKNTIMPPKGPRLTAAEVKLIREWIDQGAVWPATAEEDLKLTTKHWSFQPLSAPAVPDLHTAFAAGNPIDAFILTKLQANKLSPSAPADRVTLIRRLWFDLLGLPPSPEEIVAFVNDADPKAYERLVETALASPRYGERWARHWLDVVRFAESHGFEMNHERPTAWPYRDYVISAFNNDKPYDRFVFEQLAGDTVGADAATGFIVGGAYDQVRSPDPVLSAMQRSDEMADITNTTATTFLGLTVGCARCHNHKFDPILQKDYYSLQAVFAGVQHGERPLPRELSQEQLADAEKAKARLTAIGGELAKLQPAAGRGKTITIDDENLDAVTLLAVKNGHGVNPDGREPGRKNDPGAIDRFPNVSGGRYTWFNNEPGRDVFAYRPNVKGPHRLWVSWGCGWGTHTQDAQYLLDADGDPKTTADQKLIATIDQQRFADQAELKLPSLPLWSGFRGLGVVEFSPASAVIVRGGKTGTAITADVIVLEQLPSGADLASSPAQPPLRPMVQPRENTDFFSPTPAKWVRFTALATNSGSEPCLDEVEIHSAATATRPASNVALQTHGTKLKSSGDYANSPLHRLEHINDGLYGNGRSWISNTAGKGWVEFELPEVTTIERIVWGRDREEKYADRTPIRYQIEIATEPGQWRLLASHEDRLPTNTAAAGATTVLIGLAPESAAIAKKLLAERASLEEQLKATSAAPNIYAGRFESPRATHRLYRGDPMAPREEVAPDCLTVIGTLGLEKNAGEQARRVALAKWMIDPQNPLAPRVIANRIWQHHFGAGIVDTPSGFGLNGGRPTHPELLDYLASRLIADGWSLKSLHRLILLSNTYRQANTPREDALNIDAQCRLLWRYPPHRLEAETIRDAILATTGVLDLRMGGPGWSTFKPNGNYVRLYEPKDEFGPGEFRRAIYMTKIRMRQDGVFGTFDCPDAGQIAPKRARSTTALQALSLFNSQFILSQSEIFAERLRGEAKGDVPGQVRRAFERAYGRTPDADELSASVELVNAHGLPALCRALFNANEFLFLP